jgi:hypothetical protein
MHGWVFEGRDRSCIYLPAAESGFVLMLAHGDENAALTGVRRWMLDRFPAFEGETLPTRIATRLVAAPAAGLTLFRALNVRSPGQVRELTAAFQHAGAGRGPRPPGPCSWPPTRRVASSRWAAPRRRSPGTWRWAP